MLDENYWNSKYQHQQTGWDLGQVSPPIKAYINQLKNKEIAILIPGAGNGHEAIYLLENGFKNITVVDLAEIALDNLKSKLRNINPSYYHLEKGDFFNHQGQYDLILEQTFFCALHPDLRGNYVKHMQQLLKPNGKLAGLLFSKTFPFEGPPFGGSKKEYLDLFEAYFDIKIMEEAYNSVKPRLSSELFVLFKRKYLVLSS
ncbi:MAG: methyltransferase [Sphingobacteriales bacterium]|nr:methyltransferase [Sphingobacteriales bacterium]